MNITFEKQIYPVVFTYTEEEECPVYLFDDLNEAWQFAKDNLQEEYRVQTEENGFKSIINIDDLAMEGKVITFYPSGLDTMVAKVGQLYSK